MRAVLSAAARLEGQVRAPVPPGTRGLVIGWGQQTQDRNAVITQLKGVVITTAPCIAPSPVWTWIEAAWPGVVYRGAYICARKSARQGGACRGDQGGDPLAP